MALHILALVGMLCAAAVPATAAPAATVNGVQIPYDDYIAALEVMPVSGPSGVQPAGAAALDRLITDALLIQLAEKEGVPVADSQVQKRFEAAEKDGSLAAQLTSSSMTIDELKRALRARQAFINLATKGIQVTDNEISDYYFKNRDQFNQPLRVRIGAIISKDKSKIDAAAAKLRERADFAAVAAEMSDDPVTRQSGGVLGWVWPSQPGVPPVITNTAITLKVGGVSSPVRVQDQWVILKAIERKPPASTPIEEVRDSIREAIAAERGLKTNDVQKKLQEYQRAAAIEVSIPRFKDLPAQIKSRAAATEKQEAGGPRPPTNPETHE